MLCFGYTRFALLGPLLRCPPPPLCRVLPAFNTTLGLAAPQASLGLAGVRLGHTRAGTVSLADAGTLAMEMATLSHVTGGARVGEGGMGLWTVGWWCGYCCGVATVRGRAAGRVGRNGKAGRHGLK